MRKLDERHRQLELRRNALEHVAATELGQAVIRGGGLGLNNHQVQRLIELAVGLGIEESLRRLSDDGK